MVWAFPPRRFLCRPCQTFWLRQAVSIRGFGAKGERAAQLFREELTRRAPNLPQPWKGPGRPSREIVFRTGVPQDYLRLLKPDGRPVVLPVGESGKKGAESFRLEVNHDRILIEAANHAGFRHAIGTLFDRFDTETCFFSGGTCEDEPAFPFRAFLLNLAHHYVAPRGKEKRKHIKAFDEETAAKLMRKIAEARFNAVILDVENAVRYRALPAIARKHSRPMSALRTLVRLAKSLGLEVIPKCNFSKSDKFRHNDWFEPYHLMPDNREYWALAAKVIDELLEETQARYFHVGMDEDHRDASAYVAAVQTLHKLLNRQKVKPILWTDIDKLPYAADVELKMRAALRQMPRENLIITHWQYHGRCFDGVSELQRLGYTTLGATAMNAHMGHLPLSAPTRAFALRAKQQDAVGMVGTCWAEMLPEYSASYEKSIEVSGRAFWTAG
jgi:hypothetical protein